MDQNILITNIQRFSLHDGPGIRTTVFLKGCSIRCPWCCNPENLVPEIQKYVKDGVTGTYGEYMTCDELYNELIKDQVYYTGKLMDFDIKNSEELNDLPGGVTFSGGEAILQMSSLESLIKQLNEGHIHTAVETSLFVPPSELNIALKYISLFYVDIKILNYEQCEYTMKGSLNLYLKNLDSLFSYKSDSGNCKPVVFRIPVIAGYTDTNENIEAVIELLDKYRPIKVELVKGHNLGDSKYISLGMVPPKFTEVSNDFMQDYANMIKQMGIEADICRV